MNTEWEKTSRSWPSKEPPRYRKETKFGIATLSKEGKMWFLRVGNQERKLSSIATFVTADNILRSMGMMESIIGLFMSAEVLSEGRGRKRRQKEESRWQKFYRKLGIEKPLKAKSTHKFKSIGYSNRERGYCGWSHRAYCCFPVGKVVPDSADLVDNKFRGRKIKTVEQSKEAAKSFARSVS
jgi:hypothetical protein